MSLSKCTLKIPHFKEDEAGVVLRECTLSAQSQSDIQLRRSGRNAFCLAKKLRVNHPYHGVIAFESNGSFEITLQRPFKSGGLAIFGPQGELGQGQKRAVMVGRGLQGVVQVLFQATRLARDQRLDSRRVVKVLNNFKPVSLSTVVKRPIVTCDVKRTACIGRGALLGVCHAGAECDHAQACQDKHQSWVDRPPRKIRHIAFL